jgi:hypothetical protein
MSQVCIFLLNPADPRDGLQQRITSSTLNVQYGTASQDPAGMKAQHPQDLFAIEPSDGKSSIV